VTDLNVVHVDFGLASAKNRLGWCFNRVLELREDGYTAENQQELDEIHQKILNDVTYVRHATVANDV